MSAPGKLYLIPVPISANGVDEQIPPHNRNLVCALTNFIAEDAKTARSFLKRFGYAPLEKAQIKLLNEHTKNNELKSLLNELLLGEDVGLMSDAGCPGIADPGAEVVRMAHQLGIGVVPLVGPSAIVLSIMASGFNGQNFAFVGYLPVDKMQRVRRLRELEQVALKQGQGQFFIETPYRNIPMLETALECLSPGTLLFIGKNIGGEGALLRSATISQWRKLPKPDLHKVPVVFGIYH